MCGRLLEFSYSTLFPDNSSNKFIPSNLSGTNTMSTVDDVIFLLTIIGFLNGSCSR